MIVHHVHDVLIQKEMTLSLAESCTGGLVSHLLTNLSGASKYLKGGLIVYSIEAKNRLLGLGDFVNETNVVSEETAKVLAERVQSIFETDYGLGITGFAGTSNNGSLEMRGTAFVGVSNGNKTYVKKIWSDKSRIENKNFFAEEALKFLFTRFLDD